MTLGWGTLRCGASGANFVGPLATPDGPMYLSCRLVGVTLAALAIASPAVGQLANGAERAPLKISCDRADAGLRQLVRVGGLGHARDARAFAVQVTMTHAQADRLLYDLTAAASRAGGCAAAIAMRGVVKWQLVGRRWTPKDAPGQQVGAHWDEDAIRDLDRAAHTDRTVASDASVLEAQAISAAGGIGAILIDDFGSSLIERLASPASGADTTRELLRGRLALRLSRLAEADSSFRAYADGGGDAGTATLELARVELALGAPHADSLYYRAAASTDEAVLAGLVSDLELIADSARIDELRRVPADRRVAWLRAFWGDRDVESLRPRGSRLYEHYRRIAYARAHYRIRQYPRRFETFELWRNPLAEFDDRGLIYVRHGAPDDSAAAVRYAACPNVTWLYRRPEGNLIFHFSSRDDPDDWRLIETLFNAGNGDGATNRLRRQDTLQQCMPIDGLMASRADIDPVYARLATRFTHRDAEVALRFETRSREIGTTTDSYELRFPHTVHASLQTYGLFGDTPAEARALFVLSAPVGDLRLGPDSVAMLRLHTVATRAGAEVAHDTLREFRAHGTAASWLSVSQEIPLAPGAWNLGLVLRVGDSSGQFFRVPSADLPDAGTLALSDIVAAEESGGLAWRARDGALQLNPSGTYTLGQPIVLYYEVAGADGSLDTRIELNDGHRTVNLSFREPARSGVVAMRRTLATDRLREGKIAITVVVRSSDAHVAARTLEVRLVKGKADRKGAGS